MQVGTNACTVILPRTRKEKCTKVGKKRTWAVVCIPRPTYRRGFEYMWRGSLRGTSLPRPKSVHAFARKTAPKTHKIGFWLFSLGFLVRSPRKPVCECFYVCSVLTQAVTALRSVKHENQPPKVDAAVNPNHHNCVNA